ncbi:hypothetical protein ACFPRL_01765 [Pseudoclavibacter helvolus]
MRAASCASSNRSSSPRRYLFTRCMTKKSSVRRSLRTASTTLGSSGPWASGTLVSAMSCAMLSTA